MTVSLKDARYWSGTRFEARKSSVVCLATAPPFANVGLMEWAARDRTDRQRSDSFGWEGPSLMTGQIRVTGTPTCPSEHRPRFAGAYAEPVSPRCCGRAPSLYWWRGGGAPRSPC